MINTLQYYTILKKIVHVLCLVLILKSITTQRNGM